MDGIGVMLHQISGSQDEEHDIFAAALNKVIARVWLENDSLRLVFTDGTGVLLWDDGQSCCEDRYMRTDDDLCQFAGSVFLGSELREAPNVADEYGEHEVQFLVVKTSVGNFTMSTHNEHNGYYGGFAIRIRAFPEGDDKG